MNGTLDPTRLRLLAARGSRLERGLATARHRGPSQDDLRALSTALFGGASVGIPTARAGSSGGRLTGLTKVVTAIAVAGAIAAVTGVSVRRRRSEVVPWQPHGASVQVAAPAARDVPAELIVPLPTTEVPSPIAGHAQPTVRERRHAPAPAPRSLQPDHVDESKASAVPTTDGADAELALIGAAQAALPADPIRALALVREHEQRFRDGLLGQEREVVAVSALWESGRRDEARRRAERFAEEHPGSTYILRMRRILTPDAEAR